MAEATGLGDWASRPGGWVSQELSRRDLPDRVVIWDHIVEGWTIEYLTQVSDRSPCPKTWIAREQMVIEDA